MSPVPRRLQLVPCAPRDDVPAMADVVLEHRLEAQHLRPPVDDGEHQRAECHLQLGVLVEVVEHRVRARVRLQLDDDADLVLAPRLVVEVGDAVDLPIVDQLRDRLHQARLVDLVWQLANDDLLAPRLRLLEVHLCPHDDPPAAGAVDVGDVARVDDAARGEVRALDDADEILGRRFRVVDQANDCVADLTEVMRRDVGRHADRDSARPVDEEVGEQRRHHDRFAHPGTFAKFGPKSTVSFSISSTRLMATAVMRASVYR